MKFRNLNNMLKEYKKVSASERDLNNDKSNDTDTLIQDLSGNVNKDQHVYWFITKNENDGKLESESELKERVERISRQYVFQFEKGKECKTLHFHLLIYLKQKMRFTQLQKIFGKCKILFIKKKDLERVRDYCCKEDTRISQPCFKWKGLKIIDTSYFIKKEDLRPSQLRICNMFIKDEDPKWGRHIHWFWEENGNWGKSVCATYMIDNMGAMEVNGACSDILCGVVKWIEENGKAPRIIVIDIPRISMDKVSYRAIEQIKNGKFFSGKYESGMVRFRKPWVVVFANSEPLWENLSEDRWIVENLG